METGYTLDEITLAINDNIKTKYTNALISHCEYIHKNHHRVLCIATHPLANGEVVSLFCKLLTDRSEKLLDEFLNACRHSIKIEQITDSIDTLTELLYSSQKTAEYSRVRPILEYIRERNPNRENISQELKDGVSFRCQCLAMQLVEDVLKEKEISDKISALQSLLDEQFKKV
jgi:hypothetical protein